MIFLCKLFSLFLLLASIFFVEFGSGAPIIPKDEVQVLRTIAAKLNIKYWSVSQTSCSDGGQSFNHTFRTNVLSNVTCDCSFNSSTVCHVTNIQLKGLNLSGVLLDEFADLAHLRELDLTWNYLSGTIPKSFSKLPLMILGLLGNRLSGPIPDEITQISTLEVLVLESNQLVGPLPPNLGNLKRLRRLLLSSNFFTGTIPETFANLKNLTFFLIDGNRISGKIPEFIGNWTNISMLNLEGTAMEGPIPKNISLLKNITELRISDLNGTSATFPDLQDMKNLQTLVLRNCLLTGPIPDFIGELTNLKTIDLSFNMLTGKIPDSMQNLNQLNFMFLTNNSLTGAVPPWVLESKQKFDVSYNNFTGSPPFSCQQSSVNLVSSYSSTKDSSVTWCLKKDLPCPNKPQYHSLFINCGGGKMKYDGHDYEEDTSSGGPSNFYAYGDKWAYSSTGVYLFNDRANFIASNTLGLNMTGPVYYQTARLAPSSLKYYGLCLREGSYRVQLHFAEIQFSDDQKWTSNGRRIFDISIQGNVVLKDFNITEEAGGVGKGIMKNFKDIRVNDSTLVIHLYWAGQGTTAIPDRGAYGPLISAITVTPNFKTDTGLPAGSIAGIVIGSVMAVALVLVILRMTGYLGGRGDDNEELKRLGIGYFSLRQIKAATDDFNPINKIGEGGFGPVYKGVLQDGKVIAVKQLSAKSKQGNREFVNEIGTISALQHPNLVKLYGCCVEGKELLLIYEYLENNSLARALFGRREHRLNLDWPTRMRICLDIAKGLRFLHEESRLKIVHRDIKANNVLLDKDLNAKISDFGLAKLDEEEENTHMTTRIAGTAGYMAPEYAMRGHLSDKADVYSFGVVLLEIVSGKGNTSYRPSEEFTYLLDWAYVLQEQGDLLDLVDPILGSNYSEAEALRIMSLALLCTNPSPILRPAMSAVVSMIEGNAPVQAPIVKPSGKRDPRFRALDGLSQNSHSQASTFSSQMQSSKSTDGALLDSSASTQAMADVAGHSSSGRLLSDSFQAN